MILDQANILQPLSSIYPFSYPCPPTLCHFFLPHLYPILPQFRGLLSPTSTTSNFNAIWLDIFSHPKAVEKAEDIMQTLFNYWWHFETTGDSRLLDDSHHSFRHHYVLSQRWWLWTWSLHLTDSMCRNWKTCAPKVWMIPWPHRAYFSRAKLCLIFCHPMTLAIGALFFAGSKVRHTYFSPFKMSQLFWEMFVFTHMFCYSPMSNMTLYV